MTITICFYVLLLFQFCGDRLFDDEYVSQREIEKELFDKFDKVSERGFSLLKFIIAIAGFYSVILVNVYSMFDIDLILNSSPYPPYSVYSIKLCFFLLFLAFYSSFMTLRLVRYRFIESGRLVCYRCGYELEKNNFRVALNIRKHGFFNMLSCFCILFSFQFFLAYFLGEPFFIFVLGGSFVSSLNFIGAWLDIYGIELEGRGVHELQSNKGRNF